MNQSQLAGLFRHVITIAGGAGVFGSDDAATQVASAIAALVAVFWSAWSKRHAPPSDSVPVGLWIGLVALAPLTITGCKAPGGAPIPIVTPARVQAVASLGAYFGAKAVILKGHRAELEQALKGLQVLASTDSSDLTAVAAALEAAGVPGLGSPEGILVLGAVSTFADLWAQTGQVVLEADLARAAIQGIVRGLELALASARTFRTGDPVGMNLLEDAIASRSPRR
jgi:hypothetical protein